METHLPHEIAEHSDKHAEHLKNRAALTISILAMLLAIATVMGNHAGKDAMKNNILASNAYGFYQAKSIRQTEYKLARANLELELIKQPNLAPAVKEAYQQKIDAYKKNEERYESEPETGEGKKELLAKAREYEYERDHALKEDPWYGLGEAVLQISIVILSVSVLTGIGILFWVGCFTGLIGALCALNGYLLLLS